MAITYQLKTFADLYSAVREELKIQSTDTTSLQRIQRDINIIYLDEVVPFSNWRWLRGNLNVSVQAAFVSGTASVVQNSSTVTLTIAPASSRTRYYFSVVGYNEIYRIQSHTSGSTSLVLEAPYTGSTSATASFKIWSDEIPLPSMVRETTTITHDFQDIPLENCGLQKFRAYVASLPKAEGRPQFYTCESYSDPGYYVTNAALPAVSTRASSTLQKTLVFASDVTTYLPQGTRFRVQTAGDSTYNGEYVVATQSGATITYTGIYPLEESAIADATISIQIGVSASNDRRYKRLLIYPSINTSNQMLHVDFLKEVAPLVNDTDEPLMPIGDRVVLLYGALARAWARERNPEESARNVQMYEAKLARMAGKVDDSIEPPMLRVNRVYLGAKRSNTRQRGNSYGAPNGWVGGSGSSSALPQNTANRVAVFDATGTLNADALVSTTELEKLDGIASSAVGISDTQTLTNKTVDASLNTITNIVDTNVKANAAIAYSKLALTGSILNADLAGSIAASKLVGSDIATVGTVTSGTWSATTIAINKGGTGQTTASAAFDALSPNTTKGDLTVRTASTNTRLPIGTDGQVPVADSTQTSGLKWATLQQGAKNYVTYNNFENNATTGWSLAHTTLSSLVPNQVSGSWTSASGSLAFTAVSSGALAGTYSGQLAWTGTTTTAGDMLVSQAYSIDIEDQAKVLTFKFYYSATVGASLLNFSGTSSNTYQIYVYDVANSVWIQPAGVYGMTQGSGVGYVTGTFQTPSNMTSFRLALVCINASSSGSHTILLDDFVVGPQTAPIGVPASDPITYSLTIGGSTAAPTLGTTTTNKAQWSRLGRYMIIQYSLKQTTNGTDGTGDYLFPLPSGYSIDSSVVTPPSAAVPLMVLGDGTVFNTTTSASFPAEVFAYNTTNLALMLYGTATSNGTFGSAFNGVAQNPLYVSFTAIVPISGWSANVQMSADSDTRLVAFNAAGCTATITGTPSLVTWTAVNDTHGGYSAGTYTIQVSGSYDIVAQLRADGTFSAGNDSDLDVLIDGVAKRSGIERAGGACISQFVKVTTNLFLNAGQTVALKISSAGTSVTCSGSTQYNFLSIIRRSGPAVVAATEVVAAKYNSCGTLFTSGAATPAIWTVKEFDTHGAYNTGTGVFTCPGSGIFEVTAFILASSNTGVSAGNNIRMGLKKNGSSLSSMGDIITQVSTPSLPHTAYGTTAAQCVAGDTLSVEISNGDSNFSGDNNARDTWVYFRKLKA